jgi:hypothetical protein
LVMLCVVPEEKNFISNEKTGRLYRECTQLPDSC